MIKIPCIENQRFFVMGLGLSGFSAVASLRASGAKVEAWDDRPDARSEAETMGITLISPDSMDWRGVEAMILAPGLPLGYPEPSPVVSMAHAANVPIMGDFDLLFRACPDATYIGVTGTNGKSTTSALIHHILKENGRAVQVGGNFGFPVLDFEPFGQDGIFVLETSSFQLDLMQKNLFDVAVILNITPDHLQRHGGIEGYIASKNKITITDKQQTLITGTDEEALRQLADKAGQKPSCHLKQIVFQEETPPENGLVARAQSFHVFEQGLDKGVLPLGSLPHLPGKHNLQNAAAAFEACRAVGIEAKAILKYLENFKGLPHRQELIATIDGVKFINDSKATNAESTKTALTAYHHIYWIVGGRAKTHGLEGLEDFLHNVKHAFLIGESSDVFAAWLQGKVPHTECVTLDVAVRKAAFAAWSDTHDNAQTVLLSPAASSFDQFSNFEERGETFARLVRSLPAVGGAHAYR